MVEGRGVFVVRVGGAESVFGECLKGVDFFVFLCGVVSRNSEHLSS